MRPERIQGSVKVEVCTKCPSMPKAGLCPPTWINAAMENWARDAWSRTNGTNRDFDGALRADHGAEILNRPPSQRWAGLVLLNLRSSPRKRTPWLIREVLSYRWRRPRRPTLFIIGAREST